MLADDGTPSNIIVNRFWVDFKVTGRFVRHHNQSLEQRQKKKV
jgi:hypothetical protein